MIPSPSSNPVHPENRFDWPLCYEAENLVSSSIRAFLDRNRFSQELAYRMEEETGTLILDWVDHLVVSPALESIFRKAGFTDDLQAETIPAQKALWHPEALLPRVLVDRSLVKTFQSTSYPATLAIKVDSVTDFIAAHNLTTESEGDPLSRFRRTFVSESQGMVFCAVERRGYRGFVPAPVFPAALVAYLKAAELWKTRTRAFPDDTLGFLITHQLVDHVIDLVGPNLACHIVFNEERAYWERRNRAARIQKARQDKLGLGWSNHDHHTFRCSRTHFLDLMQALEKLGFQRRERFYAGQEAGWGAQILEHPVEGITTFCDVDLLPEETGLDFSRQSLSSPKRLGTIGLWVGLHGESFLDAGMHHLECRFDHQRLREQLAAENIQTMEPFSDFPFLKQAFTQGERWPVRLQRVQRLVHAGFIDQAQADRFLAEGAIGSHLENLQRKGGFKGFNQQSVSAIIQATDPRHHHAAA